jgi:hypothetical protein
MYEGTGYMLALVYHMYPFIPTFITRFVLFYRFVIPMFYLIRTIISHICYTLPSHWTYTHTPKPNKPVDPQLATTQQLQLHAAHTKNC